ncbi:MAG: hypothetical protein JRG76_11965 [Deltaproteobacteria bacterium]|jgi:hypothetical protein|nr:hypothetical protein [Deltaproteobacteria bacterium]MBW2415214.1 hypothetical protein [Deltaproteobacteria bacterium]
MSERQPLTARDLAIEFTELWGTLEPAQINTMLARNVSLELLEFFSSYANEFADDVFGDDDSDAVRSRLPNLLIIGYIIRILEERVD